MKGRRIDHPNGYPDPNVQPGDYWSVDVEDGEKWWYACLPSFLNDGPMSHHGVGIGISGKPKDRGWHLVVEHEDGTITVSPSILWGKDQMPAYPDTWWHGFLERGEWRSV